MPIESWCQIMKIAWLCSICLLTGVCVCVCVCVRKWEVRFFSFWHYNIFPCCAKSLCRVWLFAPLWTVVHPAPLSMRCSKSEYWSGLPCPPLEDRPNPGIEPASLRSLALAGAFFTTSATWEVPIILSKASNKIVLGGLQRGLHILVSQWIPKDHPAGALSFPFCVLGRLSGALSWRNLLDPLTKASTRPQYRRPSMTPRCSPWASFLRYVLSLAILKTENFLCLLLALRKSWELK